jgi:polysaccharide deacetylase 2 family uncharacterized protein YibQ
MIGIIFLVQRAGRPKGLVAFVIDDWGYNRDNIELLFQIKRPATIAILPNLRYSKYVAEAIRHNSKIYDIILHLPLESKSGEAEEFKTIKCNMDKNKIVSILEGGIKNVPGVIGISNHQGSRATEDKRVMKVILSELKKRGLFFLDSMTSPDSVCSDIAMNLRLRYAERDVFLDLTDQTDLKNLRSYIKNQIRELADVAIKKGSAIGIGHNKKVTLEVLRDSIPLLEKRGIKIVPLKKLVR